MAELPCRGPVQELPLPLLVVLIVAAVIAGLWLGNRAGKALPGDRRDGKPAKPIGARTGGAAADGNVRLCKWNREREQKKDERESAGASSSSSPPCVFFHAASLLRSADHRARGSGSGGKPWRARISSEGRASGSLAHSAT